MAAHGDINNKDLEMLIVKIPKFSGSKSRWRNGVNKVLNLRGYGELIPKDELLEVIPDEGEVVVYADAVEEGEELEEGATATEGVRAAEEVKEESSGETEAQRKARIRKMESPATAIISLSLQPPVSDWVDFMVAAKTKFAEIWTSLKSLYGVSSELDEMHVLESFGALKLVGHEDPVQ